MVRTKATRLISAVIAIVIMMCAAAGSITKGTMRTYAADSYRTWRQYDDRWGSIMLGSYDWSNMRGSGCLVTSLAMLAVHTGCKSEDNFNPGVMANSLKSINAFNQWGGLASWASVPQVLPQMSILWQPQTYSGYWGNISWSTKVEKLKSFMNAGYWPIVNANTHHWVLVEGIIGDKVYMIDPASDSTDLYEKYGNVNRTDQNDFDYILVKSSVAPDLANFKDPTVKVPEPKYTLSVDIAIRSYPEKTEYVAGEKLDLTGGYAQVSYVDPFDGPASYAAEPMSGSPKSFTVDTSSCDMDTPGEYNIYLYAQRENLSTSASFTITVIEPEKEYYCIDQSTPVLSAPNGNKTGITLEKGDSFIVNRKQEGYGHIVSGSFDGWADLSALSLTPERISSEPGDINGDGYADIIDLSLLNDYLKYNTSKPDGVDGFFEAERKAADVNGDSIINSDDVIALLRLIG